LIGLIFMQPYWGALGDTGFRGKSRADYFVKNTWKTADITP